MSKINASNKKTVEKELEKEEDGLDIMKID